MTHPIREALRAPALGPILIAMLKLVMAGMLMWSGCLTAGDNDSLEVECGVAWPAFHSSLGPNFNNFAVEWRCQTPGFCDADLDQGSVLTTSPAQGPWAWIGFSFRGEGMTYLGVTQQADGCFTSEDVTACPRSSLSSPKTGGYSFDAYLVTYAHGRERWLGCAR
ncbi:MAG: hypothetical protein ACRCU1_02600 [Alsobacter sp.]